MRIFFATLACLCAAGAAAQTQVLLAGGGTAARRLQKDETHTYRIQLKKGGFASVSVEQMGVDLAIDIVDPSGARLRTFDSPNGANGPEPVTVKATRAGEYLLKIYPISEGVPDSMLTRYKEENQGNYRIESVRIYTEAGHRALMAEEKRSQQAFTGWLGTQAHPFTSVDAGADAADLHWLKEPLKNVQYVGLGEATHGSSEFFRMKHRLLEFLVKEMGYTVFAIEASYAGCQNINDYVLHGKGDAHTALTSQGFWTWDTEEVIALIEWMRSYNQTVPEGKRVRFYGFDIQVNALGGGVRRVQQYLQQADSIEASARASLFETLMLIDRRTGSDSARRASAEIKDLLATMLLREEHYRRNTTASFDEALQYARVIGQLLDAYTMPSSDPRAAQREWRDYYMTANFYRLNRELPDAKVVLWAHNMHVSKDATAPVNGGLHPMGGYLHEAFGDRYYAFGFAFNQGSFQAIESGKGLQEFKLLPAKEGSLDSMLAVVPHERYIIDLRGPVPDDVRARFDAGLPHRHFGSMASQQYASTSYYNMRVLRCFDGLIFIDRTTRARPTATGRR